MIDAKELRIGNWVIANNGHDKHFKYGQVTHVFMAESGGYTVDYHYPGSWFNPIPLTPEILLACGFVKNGFGNYQIPIDNKSISIMSKKLYFAGDYLYLEEWRDGVKSHERDIITLWNKDVMKTFYLHQLQNLYYSLTHQEIIYKP